MGDCRQSANVNGTAATAQAGCLLVLTSSGKVVETIYGTLINGPWDMTAMDLSNDDGGGSAVLFVTNVLNGTVAAGGNVVHGGTVVRIGLTLSKGASPFVESMTVIGSGFAERTDPAALVSGPTGVGLSPGGFSLYVADSLNNRIVAIPFPLIRESTAHTGLTVSKGGALNDPLGLTVAANGDVLRQMETMGSWSKPNRMGCRLASLNSTAQGVLPALVLCLGLSRSVRAFTTQTMLPILSTSSTEVQGRVATRDRVAPRVHKGNEID
jgi:hypothetical protein